MSGIKATRKGRWMQKKWLTAIATACIAGALLCSPVLLGGNVGAQERGVQVTYLPSLTPTLGPVCTAPACRPGEVYHCPGVCPGGCGTECATPTPTFGPVCTPPACKPGEVYYCPGFCPGGCGTECATPTPGAAHKPPAGGSIELRVWFPEWIDFQWQALWTLVQWQDRSGHWHSVEGWQGSLDRVTIADGKVAGRKAWWLASDLLGKGPFRWVVYRVQGGKLVAESESFYLPDHAGRTVIVETALVP
jgi:hypothetical protein